MKQLQVMATLVVVCFGFSATTVLAQDVINGMIQPGVVTWDKLADHAVRTEKIFPHALPS